MRIILSPAKKMGEDTYSLPWRDLPYFLKDAEYLSKLLGSMSQQELQRLWNCNESIAKLNYGRLQSMNLRQGLTPAILAYQGISYQYMAPRVFEQGELNYVQERLRILSGFYGLLRPADGVTPYRLEMQAKLRGEEFSSLYDFWGERLARRLCEETDLIINLASKEYSRCVLPFLPERVRTLNCVFGELSGKKIVEKGTRCKMARGEMVRFMAENRVERPEELRGFDRLGYRFAPDHSDESQYIFIRESKINQL